MTVFYKIIYCGDFCNIVCQNGEMGWGVGASGTKTTFISIGNNFNMFIIDWYFIEEK